MKKFLKTLFESALFPIDDGSKEWIQARSAESNIENTMCDLIGKDERLHTTFFQYQRACRELAGLTGREQFARGVKCGANLILSVKKE